MGARNSSAIRKPCITNARPAGKNSKALQDALGLRNDRKRFNEIRHDLREWSLDHYDDTEPITKQSNEFWEELDKEAVRIDSRCTGCLKGLRGYVKEYFHRRRVRLYGTYRSNREQRPQNEDACHAPKSPDIALLIRDTFSGSPEPMDSLRRVEVVRERDDLETIQCFLTHIGLLHNDLLELFAYIGITTGERLRHLVLWEETETVFEEWHKAGWMERSDVVSILAGLNELRSSL